MKTGLGIHKKLRKLLAYWNLFQFQWRKKFLGFDIANLFIQQVDKKSIQLILRKNGAIIGKNCDIETSLVFHNCKDYSNLMVGNNCHIGKNCFFDLRDKVIIEDNCVISMQTTFITHIDMNKSKLSANYPTSHAPIIVKKNSYIGAKAIILKGVTVAEYSLISAASLVRKDTNPFSANAGVPAIEIKKLYNINEP